MQPVRSYASALLAVAVLLSGCTGGEPGSAEDVEPAGETQKTDEVATVIYMVGLHSKQDRADAPMPYGVIPVSLPDTAAAKGDLPSDQERITDAVEALLHQPRGRRDTFWAGKCAPGNRVSGVRIGTKQVTITLQGTTTGGCDLDQAMTALQAQQLAWTVVDNSDLPQDVGVRYVDGSGQESEQWVADSEMVVGK